jgi:hypothetical protein
MTVAGGAESAIASNRKLQEASAKGEFQPTNVEFSEFVVSSKADQFLKS